MSTTAPDPAGILESATVRVLCLISDESAGKTIVDAFEAASDKVTAAGTAPTAEDALSKIKNGSFNAICIDLFHGIGIQPALKFIGLLRRAHPQVPICLLGNKTDFQAWPGVPAEWKSRFRHYYKIELDAEAGVRQGQVDVVSVLFLADSIKAAGFDHYQTLQLDFLAKEPNARSIPKRVIAGIAAFMLFFVNLIAPKVFGFEERTCASLQTAYPDRVLCKGVEPGFFWRVGERVSAYPKDYASTATAIRCDATAERAAGMGEVAHVPGAPLATAAVVPTSDVRPANLETSPDPDAGIFEAHCRKIPWHQWLTWWQLR